MPSKQIKVVLENLGISSSPSKDSHHSDFPSPRSELCVFQKMVEASFL